MNLTSMIPALQGAASGWLGVIRWVLLVAAVLFSAGTVVRMLQGKNAPITQAISASLTILLLYYITVLLYLFLPDLRTQLAQLPFVSTDGVQFFLLNLSKLSEPILFGALVRLGLLAFLVNLLESFLPQKEAFPSWCLWKAVTVVLTLSLYHFLSLVLEAAVPELFSHWAKGLVFGCWTIILLAGALHWLATVVLMAVHPVIDGLYRFFFAHPLGIQCTKAIVTTLILVILVAVLNFYDIQAFSLDVQDIFSLGFAGLILTAVLFLFGKFL